ncbi:methenyltetrahydromethanopterin cyclohydrolase [Methylohalomonas lacus]|uniref:Methenyltetrahydromethanopterin cyclohydrolase n=1 Tax=Methylohalomonas lacus TaxID=398773 RepID=A0AAE3L2F3_9GAMM|nr:methenyltetrahydromethanopterin cyclohydrolase [Methylohalomonas lacus]MCS3904466.1 methenyltetrahydromethanopterin cyclohydrolase [Methylohalomonas lacus]
MTDKPENRPSVNQLTAPLVDALVDDADLLRLGVSTMDNGTRVIDAGIEARGGLEAGRLIAEICMGGLGSVSLRASSSFKRWAWNLDVYSTEPVLACLGSQYAGWALSHGEGKSAFFGLGSGPGRAMGSKEDLFKELGYRDSGDSACLVMEVDQLPPVELVDKIAEMCGIKADKLTLILTPTSSLAGCVQVVGRVLETALHKAHALEFPLEKIVDGAGSAPLCPPSGDFLTAMSRTNDAILFAGQVQLFVDADDDDAKQLAEQLPSSASKDYGKPFGEIFKAVNYDFYQIDPMLFSPARVTVSVMKSGKSYHAGSLDEPLLDRSFG